MLLFTVKSQKEKVQVEFALHDKNISLSITKDLLLYMFTLFCSFIW